MDIDQLPDHPWIKRAEIKAWLGIGGVALRNTVRNGTFPAPVKVSERRHLWRRVDVVAWWNAQNKKQAA